MAEQFNKGDDEKRARSVKKKLKIKLITFRSSGKDRLKKAQERDFSLCPQGYINSSEHT
jgi:hypothetical protein